MSGTAPTLRLRAIRQPLRARRTDGTSAVSTTAARAATDTASATDEPSVPGVPLELADVSLGYDADPVLSQVDLRVHPGEIVVVVGSSGSGKSTLLRALAGLLVPRSGRISVDGVAVRGASADRTLVFQDDGLLPWRSVRRNVELPLAFRKVPRAQRREHAEGWLDRVGLGGCGDALPRQLSGGMRQRVQLARALIGAPGVVLMDEPFGALDPTNRRAMQRLLVQVWQAQPTTVVFVTHDIDEALFLADRVVVIGGGRVASVHPVPRPRDDQAAADPDTMRLRAEILRALERPGQDGVADDDGAAEPVAVGAGASADSVAAPAGEAR